MNVILLLIYNYTWTLFSLAAVEAPRLREWVQKLLVTAEASDPFDLLRGHHGLLLVCCQRL